MRIMHYSILVMSAFVASALAAPDQSLVKRAQTYACDGKIALRLRPDKPNSEVKAQACLDLNGGEAPFLDYTDGQTEGVVTTTTTIPDKSICEHIIEVQLVKAALEAPNGACADYNNQQDDEGRLAVKAKIRQVTDIVNNQPNLIFVQQILEKLKGGLVNAIQSGQALPKPKNYKPVIKQLKAVDKYVNEQFSIQAEIVATDVDNKIAELWPNTGVTVISQWHSIKSYATSVWQEWEHDDAGSRKRQIM